MILSETWFMEGYIDFELQKYRLLAYLQEVKRSFNQNKLYPQLADIVTHYNNLLEFQSNKRFLQEQFPKQLNMQSLQKMELAYEHMLADDELMHTIRDGVELYDFVEHRLQIEPVGIMPLYKNEGYVLIRYGAYKEVRVYNYSITLFEHKEAKYRGIRMDYVDTRKKDLANTYEQIKLDIIRSIRTLPNPAVYKVEFPLSVPFDETLLPVAKRVLVKHLA